MMDMEFENVKDEKGMELIDVNTTAAREHVGEIERGIRYLKERCRCSVSELLSRESNVLQRQSSFSLYTIINLSKVFTTSLNTWSK